MRGARQHLSGRLPVSSHSAAGARHVGACHSAHSAAVQDCHPDSRQDFSRAAGGWPPAGPPVAGWGAPPVAGPWPIAVKAARCRSFFRGSGHYNNYSHYDRYYDHYQY